MAAPVQRPRVVPGGAAAGAGARAAAAVAVARELPFGDGSGAGAIGLDGLLLAPFRRGDAHGGGGGRWGRGGLHIVGGGVPDAAGDGALGVLQR